MFCLFQGTCMLLSRPLQQKIGMREMNSKQFQAGVWLHIHYCSTIGLMARYVISSSQYQGGQGEISRTTEAKGTELFTSWSELSMVRSQGYGTGSWSSSWYQEGLPDLANNNVRCWLNSDFRKQMNNILAYSCPEYCILLQYFIVYLKF